MRARAAPRGLEGKEAVKRALPGVAVASAAALAAPFPGLAEEAEGAAAAAAGGLSRTEYALALAPVLIYAGFTVYRTSFNNQAKIEDFIFAIGATVVIGNLLSIVIFKTRFF